MAGARTSPVLVGRAGELATLEAAFERAVEGDPSIVLIGGDAGVGKTRLITEFAQGVVAGGGRVLVGGCLDLGGEGLPYSPFLEALRALGEELPPDALSDDPRRDRAASSRRWPPGSPAISVRRSMPGPGPRTAVGPRPGRPTRRDCSN